MEMRTRYIDEINPAVRQLCKSVTGNDEPIFVPVETMPNAAKDQCFANVDQQVNLHGGEPVYGWELSEWPGAFIEAEFHCVWKSPDGHLVDISSKIYPVTRVLFIVDPSRKFHGSRIANRHLPITTDMLVIDYLSAVDDVKRMLMPNVGENKLRMTPEVRQRVAEYRSLDQEMMRRF